jgi:hypothetical protein
MEDKEWKMEESNDTSAGALVPLDFMVITQNNYKPGDL